MNNNGVFKAKSSSRISEDNRFSTEGLDQLKGLPWDLKPLATRILSTGVEKNLRPIVVTKTFGPSERKTRRTDVLTADVHHYGGSVGCNACFQVETEGRAYATHTDECRARMERMMAEDSAGKAELARERRKDEAEHAVYDDMSAVNPTGEVEIGDVEEVAASLYHQKLVVTAAKVSLEQILGVA